MRSVDLTNPATITDSMESKSENWDSDLIDAVKREKAHPHDKLVKFLVETFLPQLH